MLPSKNRLKKESDFASTLRSRSRAQEDFLSLKLRPNETPDTRFGVIVSKKVSKKAVERNRIHRAISESIRNHISQVGRGLDVVLLVGPDAKDRKGEEIREATERLLKKASVISS